MLFAEEDAPLIKAWIVKRLENNSDADADVLADYVLALLRHDGDVEAIRKLFEDEIPDFLREDAAAFTHDVLQAVQYRSFVPGAAPPPPPIIRSSGLRQQHFPPPQPLMNAAPRPDISSPSTLSQYTPSAPYSVPVALPPYPQRSSRKRAYNDHDDGDVDIILNSQHPYGGHPYKQPRRGGGFGQRGGRYDDPYGSRSYRGGPPFPGPPGPAPYGAPLPFAPPTIDANSIIENIQILQSLLPPTADMSMPVYPGIVNPVSRRKRCRDYDSRGYCSRGNKCNFEHVTQPSYIPPPIPTTIDEYDPNNATLSLPPFGLPSAGQQFDLPDSSLPFPANRGESKKPRRIKGRAPIAAPGPNHDKTKTTIVVQNIPSENCTEDQVRGYFSQFGNIVEVSMQTQNHVALIRFEAWEAANAAWVSPKVIFDNRFVKVFWYKEEEGGDELASHVKLTNNTTNGHVNGTGSAAEFVPGESDIDLKEFHRKQLEAQKIHEEKMKKRQEIQRERKALAERQKELFERQAEAKRQLQAKLKANGSKNGSSSTAEASTEGKGSASSQTEVLKAQLAALEQEANQLGIDPDDAHDDSSSWFSRGRGRGRGYRGRGTFSFRAGYGAQGRGGAVEARHAAYAAYSLDNRPKSITLSGVDFTAPENDEALRQYLFSVGEFEIHGTQAATHVTFKERKTAEKFMFGISSSNSIIGIEGKIESAWAKTVPESVKTAEGDTISPGNQEDEHIIKEKAGVDPGVANGELEEGEIDNSHDVDQGDMDYEAGEW